MFLTLIQVAFGGAIGSVLRYWATAMVSAPFGTGLVNVLGSFAMGILFVTLSSRTALSPLLMTGILGGQISAVFMPIHQALTNVQAGRIVMLSASGTKRSSATPNVPSLGEAAGIRDIDVDIWFGVYFPAATPKDIVTKLSTEINAILKLPEVAETLAKQGLQPTGGTPAELADLTSSDLDRWARVIRDANIRAD